MYYFYVFNSSRFIKANSSRVTISHVTRQEISHFAYDGSNFILHWRSYLILLIL